MSDETPVEDMPVTPEQVRKNHEALKAQQEKKFRDTHAAMVSNSVDQLRTQIFLEWIRLGHITPEMGQNGEALKWSHEAFQLACTFYETNTHYSQEESARMKHLIEINLKTLMGVSKEPDS